ncbi:MAG: hypothetical protein QOG43_393 [Actinomycetota bacterium]|jgi:peptidoglycan/LPS O-acetylase OafA/YrhL|nr:hypothetical protein [Actinomycetota bacterium]
MGARSDARRAVTQAEPRPATGGPEGNGTAAPEPAPPGVAHAVQERLGYRPALDGLRAIAVSGVIIGHFWEWSLPGGFIGVDLFFVLSGFLITTLLLEERARTGRLSLRYFYARRALRLLPALGFLLAFVAVWVLLASPSVIRDGTISGFPSVIFYYSNWYWGFFGNNVGVFGHLWSLSVEEQFYILWPAVLLVFLAYRRGLRVLLGTCLVVIVAASFLRWEMAQRNFTDEGLRRLTKLRGDILLVGCALALAIVGGWLPKIHRQVAVAATFVSVGVLVFFAVGIRHGASDPLFFKGGYTMVALAAAVLIYRVVYEPAGLLVKVLSTRPLVVVGRLSYALYLWHVPLRDIVKPHLGGMPGPLRPLAVLVLTVAAAAISFALVERPALRLKDRFTPRRPPPPPPAAEAEAPTAAPAAAPAEG